MSVRRDLGLTGALFAGTRAVLDGLFATVLVLYFLSVSGDTFLRRIVEILPTFSDRRQAVDISQQNSGRGPMIGQRRPAIDVVGGKPGSAAKFELIRGRCGVRFGGGPSAIAKADRAARADLRGLGVKPPLIGASQRPASAPIEAPLRSRSFAMRCRTLDYPPSATAMPTSVLLKAIIASPAAQGRTPL